MTERNRYETTYFIYYCNGNFFSASAACTVTNRVGLSIDLYSIDDIGHAYDNHRVVLMQENPIILIQQSGVDFTTWEETRFCEVDGADLRCPWDDIDDVTPGVQYRSPIYMHIWDNCLIVRGADFPRDPSDYWLPGDAERHWFLGFWYEDKIKDIVNDSIAEMELEALNALQQKRALKYILFGHGVPLLGAGGATLMAADRIDNGVVWDYDRINLVTIPQPERNWLRHVGSSNLYDW